MTTTIAIKGVQRPGHTPVPLTVLEVAPPKPEPDRSISRTERR